MRGLVHLEEYLENLEIPVDVDKKEKHTTLFLCGGETVWENNGFYSYV